MKIDSDPFLNIYSIQSYIQVCANAKDRNVVFRNVDKPSLDGKTYILPKLRSGMKESDLNNLIRYINHETSHDIYGTDFNFVRKNDLSNPKNILGTMWGFYEDMRVDHHDYKEWRGDGEHMEAYYDEMAPKMTNLIRSVKADTQLDEFTTDQLTALIASDFLGRAEWMETPGAYVGDMLELLPPKAQEYVAQMHEQGYLKRINELGDKPEDSREVYEISKEIMENIFQLTPEEIEKQEEEQKQGDGGGDGKSASADGGEEEGYEKAISKYDDMPMTSDLSNTSKRDVKVEYSGNEKYGFNMATEDALKILDYEKEKATNISMPPLDYGKGSHVDRGYDWDHGHALAGKVRRLLQIQSRDRYKFGQKKGKLDGKNLYRITMRDAKGFNERVFKQRFENDTLDTAVSLLVDFSGSMGGTKIATAIHSALLLAEAINTSLRIPLEVLGFSDQGKSSIISIFKTFDLPCSTEILKDRMLRSTRYMIQNADGEAVLYQYSRIKPRKEKRKIMIVLSDGSPASDRSGSSRHMEEVSKRLKAQREVDLYGIGICDDNVERYYNESKVIWNPEELEDALLSVIEKKLL